MQERVRVFLWLLAHDKLLSSWSQWRRKLSSSPCCHCCSAKKEDVIHALRDCLDSKEVWLKFIPPGLHHSFFSLGLQEWLLTNLTLKEGSSLEMTWTTSMALLCWKLWKWRCQDLFEQWRFGIDQKVEDVQMSICEMEWAFKIGPVHRVRKWHCNVLGDN